MCMTSIYHVVFLSQLFKKVRGGCHTYSSTLVETLPSSLTQGTCFFPLSNALFITHMPFFRDIMDLAQTFEVVAWEKTIYVTELDRNRKYRILRAKRLTSYSAPLLFSLSFAKGQPRPKYSCLGDIVTSLRTPILNRLIAMLCSCISSTEAYVQQRKLTC